MRDARAFLKNWLPPALICYLRTISGTGIRFSGKFKNWNTAENHASGYNSSHILEKVKEAAFKVKAGNGAFERDSVVFEKPKYPFPIIATVVRAMVEHNGKLSVLDFGGSLGSTYFQCLHFFPANAELHWGIIEQEHYVECGKSNFADGRLQFYASINEYCNFTRPHVVLLASVLQYLPDPYATLDELMSLSPEYIIIDRTPFLDSGDDIITVQHVPSSIYPASYPCRIFSKTRILKRLLAGFELLAEIDADEAPMSIAHSRFGFNGLILKKR